MYFGSTYAFCLEMKLEATNKSRLAIKYLFIVALFLVPAVVFAQKSRVDSLSKALREEKRDTSRVLLMWQLSKALYTSNPDTALQLAQSALYLARHVKFVEGQSLSLGILATTFRVIGNYPRALELNLERLQLEEKKDNPHNLASVLMNIGIIYRFQDEYNSALEYYSRADSVISTYNIEDYKPIIALNIGDAWDHLNISDSSFKYFNKSLVLARSVADDDLIGQAMTGLGHSFRKTGKDSLSLLNYHIALGYLQRASDDETRCEAALGLAALYQTLDQPDSAGYYARFSLELARKDGFSSKEYDAAEFLTNHYKQRSNIDSAFAYAEYSRQLNDSLNSKAKIRELQVLFSNEQFRQRELEEDRIVAAKRRHQQLQLLLIGIFIPGLFLVTLILSRRKIQTRVIKALGVLSLLFFFEYLTLLLHPTVAELTGHTPIWEILIFVGVAAVLIPLHHRAEHFLIEKLIQHRIFRGQVKKLRVHVQGEKEIHLPD
jgi:hypothetical protein